MKQCTRKIGIEAKGTIKKNNAIVWLMDWREEEEFLVYWLLFLRHRKKERQRDTEW